MFIRKGYPIELHKCTSIRSSIGLPPLGLKAVVRRMQKAGQGFTHLKFLSSKRLEIYKQRGLELNVNHLYSIPMKNVMKGCLDGKK